MYSPQAHVCSTLVLNTSACFRDGKACVFTTSACLKHSRDGMACVFITSACLRHCAKTGALIVHAPQAQDRSHASSSLSSPKQQDTLKSATILFRGGSGRRDDARNHSRPGLAASQSLHKSCAGRVSSIVSRRARFLGRCPYVVPRICILSVSVVSNNSAFPRCLGHGHSWSAGTRSFKRGRRLLQHLRHWHVSDSPLLHSFEKVDCLLQNLRLVRAQQPAPQALTQLASCRSLHPVQP